MRIEPMKRSGVRSPAAERVDPPSEDEIAERAYQIYLSRGRGAADENWRRAEEELLRASRSRQ